MTRTVWIAFGITWAVCLTGGCSGGLAQPAARQLSVQIVQHYFLPLDEQTGEKDGKVTDLNPFRYYTGLGSDFGRMGPDEYCLDWKRHSVTVGAGDSFVAEWAGMWHSLSGLAREDQNVLDFNACYPSYILPRWQPKCVGVSLTARGSGRLKLELKSGKSPGETLLWDRNPALEPEYTTQIMSCEPEQLRSAKFINWVAEMGTKADIDSLGLVIEFPKMTIQERVFLISYAKFARCYSRELGIVRDRSNFPVGDQECVPTSGMFCLATCAAWKMGMVDRAFAQETLRAVHRTMSAVPTAYGLLPHFVNRPRSPLRQLRERVEAASGATGLSTGQMASRMGVSLEEWCRAEMGGPIPAPAAPRLRALSRAVEQQHKDWASQPYRIIKGIEFSTVDTALYFHAMLLAARMLDDERTLAELLQQIKAIEFENLRDAEGFVVHGVRDDGTTKLTSSWRHWGGETALVLMLAQMAGRDDAPAMMEKSGHPYQGVGFIPEIQSLLYPQFAQHTPDRLTAVDWAKVREDLLAAQMSYFPKETAAGRLGVYGLSAGEGFRGLGYFANGTEVPKPKIITLPNGMQIEQPDLVHPHYMLMSAALRSDPEKLCQTLAAMEQRGILAPWGLAENVTSGLDEYLPLLGSLNASFEALGAYHLWAKVSGAPDGIYEAAKRCTPAAKAMELFYAAE